MIYNLLLHTFFHKDLSPPAVLGHYVNSRADV